MVVVVKGGGGKGGGTPDFKEEDNQMGVKNKTQKIPRASNKTPKILDQTLTPQKSYVEFLSLKKISSKD